MYMQLSHLIFILECLDEMSRQIHSYRAAAGNRRPSPKLNLELYIFREPFPYIHTNWKTYACSRLYGGRNDLQTENALSRLLGLFYKQINGVIPLGRIPLSRVPLSRIL